MWWEDTCKVNGIKSAVDLLKVHREALTAIMCVTNWKRTYRRVFVIRGQSAGAAASFNIRGSCSGTVFVIRAQSAG